MDPILTGSDQGLSPDTHPIQQKPGVTYVLNGRAESYPSGSYQWSNEPASELAFSFPDSYSCYGTLRIPELNRTLVFLGSGGGVDSQIGEFKHNFAPEQTAEFTPVGSYTTILTSQCLGFQKELSVGYQLISDSLYLYIADGISADKLIRLQLDSAQKLSLHKDSRKIIATGDCKEPVYGDVLDCNRARIDPLGTLPEIRVTSISTGGSFPAGAVQFRVAYATAEGERLTEFGVPSGFVSLFDTPLSTKSGETTSKSVTVQINPTAQDVYTHIMLGVLLNIGGEVRTYQTPVYPVTQTQITLLGNEVQLPLSLSELLEAKVHYDHSGGLVIAADRLLRYELTEKEVPNLQKFLFNIPVQWVTTRLREGTYADGVISSKYRTYPRDEVLALGIVFEYEDGSETGVFHLPGRASVPSDWSTDTSDDGKALDPLGVSSPKWKVRSTGYKNFVNPTAKPGEVYESGVMGYYQSTELYPNRPDVWGTLCGTPIRHHKLPSSAITHIHDGLVSGNTPPPLVKNSNYIYPIGFQVDSNAVWVAIQQAEAAGVVKKGAIKKFRLVRADRTGHASVVARGALFNTNTYQHKNKTVFYPNYPFNDLRADQQLRTEEYSVDDTPLRVLKDQTPLKFSPSNRYTFHSPDTSFTSSGKADYLQIETEEVGIAEGEFVKAEGQAEQKLLTNLLRSTAFSIAPKLNPGSAGDIIEKLANSETYKILLTAAVPYESHEAQYVGVGYYNGYKLNTTIGSSVRVLDQQANLSSSVQRVGNDLINNRFRESSVFLRTVGSTLPVPSLVDNSRTSIPAAGLNSQVVGNISVQYATLRVRRDAQYGALSSIQYLELGDPSTPIDASVLVNCFGGDTFINRFSLKRKHSFFTQTRFNLPAGSDVNYSQLANVAYPTYFYDTSSPLTSFSAFNGNDVFGSIAGYVNNLFTSGVSRLDADSSKPFYKNGYIHLYSYGIPYFLCESSVNLDLRRADDLAEGGFFPQVDPLEWTQEAQVSISKDNTYLYDRAYSAPLRQNKLLAYPDYQKYNQLSDQYHPNRVIYSELNNFRYYKPLNSYDFGFEQGKLTSLDALEASKVIARFTGGSSVYNAYEVLPVGEKTVQLGTGGMFATKPQQFIAVDGGAIGSQHRDLVKSPYGAIWVDAAKGGIYLLAPGQFPTGLHQGAMEFWLQQRLPSKLKSVYPELPDASLPVRIIYDERNHRVLITRVDYFPIVSGISYNATTGLFLQDTREVKLTDSTRFENRSWTIGYHFPTKTWSYYSFTPDRYLGVPTGFVSVYNQNNQNWIHRSSKTRYQRFGGKPYPFVLGVSTTQSAAAARLASVTYAHDVRKYTPGSDSYVQLDNQTYDSLTVSTDRQTSGVLTLQPANTLSMRDLIAQTPRTYQVEAGVWNLNGIVDKTNYLSAQPLWSYDPSGSYKFVNNAAVLTHLNPFTVSPIIGSGFTFTFTQNSRFDTQFIHQFIQPDLRPV